MPSCPCVVYGSSAASVMTPSSGTAALTARIARAINPSGFQASAPSGVFKFGSIFGNNAIAGMPRLLMRSHSRNQFVDRIAFDAGHRRDALPHRLAVDDEHRIDQVVGAEVVFREPACRENSLRRFRRSRVVGNWRGTIDSSRSMPSEAKWYCTGASAVIDRSSIQSSDFVAT